MNNPISTYRIQFHKGFTFDDFQKIIPYLQNLGIKTLYASPIFEATPGSMHGYDVVDPLRINPEIGTIEQLREISNQLKEVGIGWLQDIVPNHMAFHPNNQWLMDVLENGRKSFYADFFDIFWDHPACNGQIMAPFLGSPFDDLLGKGEIKIIFDNGRLAFDYYGQQYPLNISSYATLLSQLDRRDDIEEFKSSIQHLTSITDANNYTDTCNELKQRYQYFFQRIFTGDFLKGINTNNTLLKQVADEQIYRLCFWQETDKQINFRRFFTVNGLICLNMQDEAVFNYYHQFIKEMVDAQVFHGLRVDHIDGLYDPKGYLERLRNLVGNDTYIIVEKILEEGEPFPADWPVQGNTGYDFLANINNVFTLPKSEKIFDKFYKAINNKEVRVTESIFDKKRMILSHFMGGELDNLYHLFKDLELANENEIEKATPEVIKSAIAEVLIHCPVYRYYGNVMPLSEDESKVVHGLFADVIKSNKHLKPGIALLERALLLRPADNNEENNRRALRFYQRLMQFTGPLMAKGVEDTLMYSYNRFIDHNEVGDSPGAFGVSLGRFHELMSNRGQHWPLSMNATSTHDTKRGEDVRARLNVLTDIADEWVEQVKQWLKVNSRVKTNNAPDVNDEYFIYQTLIGAYPALKPEEEAFTERMLEYIVKALREAKNKSNWTQPDEEYENRTKDFIKNLLNKNSKFYKSFSVFNRRIAEFGVANSLAQMLLKYTCPGVPDLYQGCELWDLSLVDPDNRRPVNYVVRQDYLTNEVNINWKELWKNWTSGQIKLQLTKILLGIHQSEPQVWASGEYIPLKVKGTFKENILAYARKNGQSWYLIALPLHAATICEEGKQMPEFDWKDTRIMIPAGAPLNWQNLLTRSKGWAPEAIQIAEIFKELPLGLLRLEHSKNDRKAGILMHITSLPSNFGIGDLGSEAYDFADLLFQSRQTYWQMLPINPIDSGAGYSPYSCISSVAGNTLLISPELLTRDDLLKNNDLKKSISDPSGVNYAKAAELKNALFSKAYRNFVKMNDGIISKEFANFKSTEAYWLDDFSMYLVLKDRFNNQPWYQWPNKYKMRDEGAIKDLSEQEQYDIDRIKWLQFIFTRQWAEFKSYCSQRNITLFGDMPFYISYDSADVWSKPQFFNLNNNGDLKGIAGVPPDYFSADGQLWGMPVYKWDKLKEDNYDWWIKRIKRNLQFFDLIRLDHFRAFADYWEVPGGSKTAKKGSWHKGPGIDFFECLKNEIGSLPFVAEDLGDISDAVYKLRDQLRLPGMKVLQFAFDEAMPVSEHIPHNYTVNSFAYTGTHDNNTIMGWYKHDAAKDEKKRLQEYRGIKLNSQNVNDIMIRMCYSSVAKTAIIPMQDVLGLDDTSRMNIPSSAQGNWTWQLSPKMLTRKVVDYLQALVIEYNR